MRITEFARALGISPDTVRRLEERGLVTATRDWVGHRRFNGADLARARAALFGGSQGGPSGPAQCARRRRERHR